MFSRCFDVKLVSVEERVNSFVEFFLALKLHVVLHFRFMLEVRWHVEFFLPS